MMDKLLTIKDFCDAARITDRTYRNMRDRGDVPPCFKIGRRILMRPDAVAAWIEERETTAEAA